MTSIESRIITYLQDTLKVDAYAEIPADPDGRTFLLVDKTGSARTNQIPSAIMAVQSFAPSKAEASALNDRVVAAMLALPEQPDISACRLNSDYEYTDTSLKLYRYQVLFEIVYFD